MLLSAALEIEWRLRRWTRRVSRFDRPDPDATDPDAPAHLTTIVIRPPVDVATSLAALAAGLVVAQPGQYAYPAASIHVTLVGPVALPSPMAVDGALADLADAAGAIRGGRLRVVRLRLGAATVFAEMAVEGADLHRARLWLRRRRGFMGRRGPAGLVATRLFWANLVRFSEPPSPSFIDAFEAIRRTGSAPFAIPAIELVRTNNVMAPVRTEVLGRVPVATR